VAPAIAVAVPASAPSAAASAATLPSAAPAASTALLGPVAALAVNRAVATGFERYRRGLSTTGANYSSACAHAGAGASTSAVPAFVLGMGRSVPATTGTLLSLAAWFTTSGRRVAAFLEKLLFTSGENKFLTAVATGK
jgi:hypothetical protein